MNDLANLKQTLRDLVTEGEMEAAFLELEKHLPPDVPKFNTLLQLRARLNDVDSQRIKKILSEENITLKYNSLRDDVYLFFSGLQESDFSLETAKKANMGSVLYRIPDKMQTLKKTKCIVRVAYDEALLKDTLDTTVDVVIEALKVSKNMEVKLVDEEGDGEYFEITSRSTPEQFLVQDEYTEWTFFVKPLEVGTYPLALIISLIIHEDGKDRKKDIVLERSISVVTESVPEEAGDHTLRKAGIIFALTDFDKLPAGNKSPKKAPKKLLTGALVLIALAILAWLFWPKPDLDVFNLDGDGIAAKEERDFNAAKEQNSPELLIAFLAGYENSKFELQARELATKLLPKINLDSAITVYRLKNNIEPIDRAVSLTPTSTQSGENTSDPSSPNDEKQPEDESGTGPGNTVVVDSNSTGPNGTPTPQGGGGTDPNQGGTNAGGTTNAATGQPVVGNPNTATPTGGTEPPKPAVIKWNDKVSAKEDPINWLPTTMVKVKGGRFKMGCNTKIETTGCAVFAEPSHEVIIKDFNISRFEVTQALWMAVMGERRNPSRFDDCDLCPVERVSWDDAQDFIKKLNRMTGGSYRLPTEAEWEYASRQGGKDVRFGDGSSMAKTANFNFNAADMPGRRFEETGEFRQRTVDVFMLKANSLGLYHMSGNVAEWCEDRWHNDYEGAPTDGSAWVEGNDNRRVIRGGGWDTEPYATRTYDRDAKKENTNDDEVGLRLVW